MIKLLGYIRAYLKETILAPAFKLLEALFELFVPLVVAAIIDVGIIGGNTGYIWKMALIMLLLSFVGFAASVTAQYFAAKASVGFATNIRSALFSKIQSMSFTELDSAGTSTLITRMTSDINQVQSGMNLTLRLFLRSPFIVFGSAIMALTINPSVSLIFAVMIAVLSVVVFYIILGTVPLHKNVQGNLDEITRITRENLTGVRILRGFCMEDSELQRFSKANSRLEASQRVVGRITSLMNPLTYLLVNLSIMALLYSGAVKIDSGVLSQGELVALYNYMTQILVELVKLANLIITITKSVACGQRVQAVMDSGSGEAVGGVVPTSKIGTPVIEFRNVSFRYSGALEESLKNVSFAVNEGETLGVIGATGSGKTTLVNLIPGFYPASEGEVLVDGVSVCDADIDALREKIGVVMQNTTLFKGTIKENLDLRGTGATDEELESAILTAQAGNIIESKSGGLLASVKQYGRNFSGGQKQRLTIARALVGEPEILILDDSSSALDYATDASLRRALSERTSTRATVIVSQRTSSIMNADKIIVLDDGATVGIGTHAELLESCETYREIHELQFGTNGGGNNA